jgi:type VI secretion system protein ImpB
MADNRVRNSGQKFIARNRAPRVQIEYDVEIYGSERKIQLPFVMGVIADLAGKQVDPMPDLAEREFMPVDIDNFDERMKAIKPRVAFQVPNTLTGDGQMNVDITFDSMDDFSPARIARQVDALQQLLEARTELSNLLSYMDGKNGAEQLIAQALQNPALLKSLASAPNPAVAKAVEAANEKSGSHGAPGAPGTSPE